MAHKTFCAACIAVVLVVGCPSRAPLSSDSYDEDAPAGRSAASGKPTPVASAVNGRTVSDPTPSHADTASAEPTTWTSTPAPRSTEAPAPSPTPDTRWDTPGIRTLVTPNATQGIWELEASLVSGVFHPDMRVIAERREVRFGEWLGVVEVHPQQLIERNGEVFVLTMVNIPGYSDSTNREGGTVFRWNAAARSWEFQKEFTGLFVHHPWYRSEQLAGIFQNILVPLVRGTGWKYSFADGSVPSKVTLNTPAGARTIDIASLEEWLPICSAAFQCGTGQGARSSREDMENIFNGKIVEAPSGLVLVTVQEKVGASVLMPDGSGFTPRWQEFSVWIQRASKTTWEKRTNFSRSRSQDTLFIERIPGGVNAPFGATDFIAIFGDGPALLMEEQWLFR